jgi:hypothetical protein
MRPLAPLERLLERIFERPGARLFHVRVEPVTLARRLERAVDEERRPGPEGPVAPTRFWIGLHPRDYEGLDSTGILVGDLEAAALDHARRRGYRIPERPTVELGTDPATPAGDVHLKVGFADAAFERMAPVAPRMDRTMVHPAGVPGIPAILLRVHERDGRERVVPVDTRAISIGRARDNDLSLDDPLASRHHARIVPRAGHLVLTDLGSTNGTLVNGRAVREAVLGLGDRVAIGGTWLEVVAPTSPARPAGPAGPADAQAAGDAYGDQPPGTGAYETGPHGANSGWADGQPVERGDPWTE